ncbi:UDP-N-acetylglucosamine 1-carboxyvinyltransferase, partial [bacterium (candidate division B38) B3_B38]
MHIQGLREMGAEIEERDGYIYGMARRLSGCHTRFYYPTFSGTQNIIIAACLADGVTIIENAAKNPEVVDFINFLKSMGAEIEGGGTETVKIKGVSKLHGT